MAVMTLYTISFCTAKIRILVKYHGFAVSLMISAMESQS